MRIAIAAGVIGLAGCAAPPLLSADPRVTILPQAGVVMDRPPNVTTDAHGFTDISIELRNPTPHDLAVTCVVDWFNANGQPSGGLSAQPTRVAVAAYAADFCRTVSPNAGARAFRVAINPAF